MDQHDLCIEDPTPRRRAAGPPGPETRRAAPRQRATPIATKNIQPAHHTEIVSEAQRVALVLARRHLIRLPIALIIAGELGIGGAR
jgi:hypothetical protein